MAVKNILTAAAATAAATAVSAMTLATLTAGAASAATQAAATTQTAATTQAAATTAAPTRCAPAPSSCGYPDATTTGVPAGTKLLTVPGQVSSGPGWYFDTRGWVEVNGDGANLSGLYIPYTLDISASGVTINHVKVITSGQSSFGISVRHTTGVTIENSTITGVNATTGRLMAGIKDIYADSTGLQVLGNNISKASTGVQLETGLVQGNYIHNMGYQPGDHLNGITSNGGATGLLTITRNTIFTNFAQTDAISLFEDFGAQANRVITGNLLAGGGYAIYAGQNTGGPTATHITITGNRIATTLYPHGGYYGPSTDYNPAGTGNTWTGNIWDNTTATIPAPAS